MCILPHLGAKICWFQWYRESRLWEIFFYQYRNRQLPVTLVHLWELCNDSFLLSLIFLLLFCTALLLLRVYSLRRRNNFLIFKIRGSIISEMSPFCSLFTPLESVMGPSYLIVAKQKQICWPNDLLTIYRLKWSFGRYCWYLWSAQGN